MIRVYYLPTESNGSKVKGAELIHDALLDFEGNIGKLIMHTTDAENQTLTALASLVREPTAQELESFNASKNVILPFIGEKPRDLAAEVNDLKARIEKLEQIK